MKTDTIGMCVVALLLGMLLANMLKNVCGCKVVEGQGGLQVRGNLRASGHSSTHVGSGGNVQVGKNLDILNNSRVFDGGDITVDGNANVRGQANLIIKPTSIPASRKRPHKGGKK